MKKSLFHVVTLVALTIGVILTLTHSTNYAAGPTTQQQIDALNQRVTALEQQVSSLQTTISSLQDFKQKVKDSSVWALRKNLVVDSTSYGPRAVLTGINVQIVNGAGSTGSINGLGNLIVGYDEPREQANSFSDVYSCSTGLYTTQTDCESHGAIWAITHKSGSHNLIVGPYHNYSQAACFTFGYANTVNGANGVAAGGYFNKASGSGSSVMGGLLNVASGTEDVILGGWSNTTKGAAGGILAGYNNTVAYDWGAIVGGGFGTTSGEAATVTGGFGNTASGRWSNVSGGLNRTSSGDWNWTAGSLTQPQ